MITYLPTIIQKTEQGAVPTDIVSRLLANRIVLMFGEIDTDMATSIVSQLYYLEADNPDAPITIYVNGPGGEVTAGYSIIDAIRFISCPVHTVGMGMCCSMDAVILMSGDYRMAMPNTEIMIHQPLGGAEGQSVDIEIAAKNIKQCRDRMYKQIGEMTGQPISKIEKDCDRDNFMTAEEALNYGIIDEIIKPRKRKEKM